MKVIKTEIDGVVILEPKIFGDERGYFYESFSAKEFAEKVNSHVVFVQDNQSYSSYGVLRGLHFQKPPYTQSKLVRVILGQVIDVSVDVRRGSPTYGLHVSVELSEEKNRKFFVPRGFAHGFVVLSETAVFLYKCDNFYVPVTDGCISILDDSIGMIGRFLQNKVLLSEKDTKHTMIKYFDSPFNIEESLY